MNFKVIGCEGVDWINMAQNMKEWRTLENAVMNLQVPTKAVNLLTS
jgi:hypothetical protein